MTDDSPTPDSFEAPGTTTVSAPSTAATAFENDNVQAATVGDSARAYLNRLRGGDMGSLPAILGLIVLFVVFSSLDDHFLTKYNMANLVVQAASICVLAMGLVFVLLLGEIDLSAGVAGGASATITALYLGRVAADVPAKDVNHSQIVELITAGRSGNLGIAENPATASV